MEGFSPRNLWRMRAFYRAWRGPEILPQAVAELPWGHNALAPGEAAGRAHPGMVRDASDRTRLEPGGDDDAHRRAAASTRGTRGLQLRGCPPAPRVRPRGSSPRATHTYSISGDGGRSRRGPATRAPSGYANREFITNYFDIGRSIVERRAPRAEPTDRCRRLGDPARGEPTGRSRGWTAIGGGTRTRVVGARPLYIGRDAIGRRVAELVEGCERAEAVEHVPGHAAATSRKAPWEVPNVPKAPRPLLDQEDAVAMNAQARAARRGRALVHLRPAEDAAHRVGRQAHPPARPPRLLRDGGDLGRGPSRASARARVRCRTLAHPVRRRPHRHRER